MKALNRFSALYIRVSTDAQAEEGYSIEAQKDMLSGYCKSKRITDYKFYIDGGFSGSNIERPQLQKLIIDIKSQKIDRVIVYKLDRLSRSQKDTLYLIEDVLNPNDTEFVSLNENLDTSTSIGRAMLGIMSAFAQLERETIKERTRMGMKKRVQSGLWMGGGKIPFGFNYDRNSGKLVPSPDADTVKEIYRLYINGNSAAKIADILGFRYDSSITQILKRKLNYGAIEYKGEVTENCHEGIIDKSTYQHAMEIMESRKNMKTDKSVYLLSGLMYCGICGAKLRYQKWGKSGTKILCYSRQKSKKYMVKDPYCTLDKFCAEEIENYVLNDIFNVSTDKIKKTDNNDDILYSLKKLLSQKEKMLSRYYDIFAMGDDLLLSKITTVKDEIEELKIKIEKEKNIKAKTKEKINKLKKIDTVRDIWGNIEIVEKQQFLRSIIDKIIVTNDTVKIVYKL